ncbi:Shedu anti-phage system protein SduA domain-containing protein [Pseudonocardia alni]|uniref:Shedu anti-phage system protein SduA domain-containing protein n=1 Tax=Pseudonocardia alni TaxID=33907 RepID=UPI00279B573E|nr:DUF4263 domain-containing protein [Pseudonocardia alni]
MTYGDPETGRISTRTFRVQTWNAHAYQGGYDFSRAANTWACDDSEMAVIQAFLNNHFAEPGEYLLLRADSEPAVVLNRLSKNGLPGGDLEAIARSLAEKPELAHALAKTENADLIRSILTRSTQSHGLERLRAVVTNPKSIEPDIQKVLQREWWVFGGKYVSAAVRRSYTVLDQFDIVLIRADGSLHLIEIKQANIPKLVVPDHNHWIVGDDVHKAVGQSMNYLRSLDEQRAQILADFGIDCRRASATVVLGYPDFIRTGATAVQLSEAIRTYNSHLARIEVITYDELIQTAERFLELGSEQVNVEATSNDPDIDHRVTDPWSSLSPSVTRYEDPWADEPPL